MEAIFQQYPAWMSVIFLIFLVLCLFILILFTFNFIDTFKKPKENQEYRVTIFNQLKHLSTFAYWCILFSVIFPAFSFVLYTIIAYKETSILFLVIFLVLLVLVVLQLYILITTAKIHYQYLKNERGRKIILDITQKSIRIIQESSTIIISAENISYIAMQFASNNKFPSGSYRYVKIITTDGAIFFLTSLIIDPYFVSHALSNTNVLNTEYLKDKYFCFLH